MSQEHLKERKMNCFFSFSILISLSPSPSCIKREESKRDRDTMLEMRREKEEKWDEWYFLREDVKIESKSTRNKDLYIFLWSLSQSTLNYEERRLVDYSDKTYQSLFWEMINCKIWDLKKVIFSFNNLIFNQPFSISFFSIQT